MKQIKEEYKEEREITNVEGYKRKSMIWDINRLQHQKRLYKMVYSSIYYILYGELAILIDIRRWVK